MLTRVSGWLAGRVTRHATNEAIAAITMTAPAMAKKPLWRRTTDCRVLYSPIVAKPIRWAEAEPPGKGSLVINKHELRLMRRIQVTRDS
jgi:hypothetical protein